MEVSAALGWLGAVPGLEVEEGWRYPFPLPAALPGAEERCLFAPEGRGWAMEAQPGWAGFVARLVAAVGGAVVVTPPPVARTVEVDAADPTLALWRQIGAKPVAPEKPEGGAGAGKPGCEEMRRGERPEAVVLGGNVTVKFVIGADGSVGSATTRITTLNNAAFESCINGRFMRMNFPKPSGGGIVIVSYPFIFSSQ